MKSWTFSKPHTKCSLPVFSNLHTHILPAWEVSQTGKWSKKWGKGHCLDSIPEMMGLKTGVCQEFLESLFLLSFKPDFSSLELLDNASLLKHVESQLSLEMRCSLASWEFCGLARLWVWTQLVKKLGGKIRELLCCPDAELVGLCLDLSLSRVAGEEASSGSGLSEWLTFLYTPGYFSNHIYFKIVFK